MIDGGIKAFQGRRVLLLQGPVGPFFKRFARDLHDAGAQVHKLNFNAGDWFFFHSGETYRGTMEDWPRWLEQRLRTLKIDIVFLFGDCRPIHRAAHEVATGMGIEVGVFEEGYIRPDFVTLERDGVNANSLMTRTPEDYLRAPDRVIARRPMPHSFWAMVWWGFLYFTIGGFGQMFFPHYCHHRPLTIMEMFPWLLSPLRKGWFKWRQRGVQARLEGELDKRFFLVPLQVHNDSQVVIHADVGGVEGFIASTIVSFAAHAPANCVLVFKHHPMDRGYRDYSALIRRLSRAERCEGRVLYIHDQHTPTLIRHCRGVVVINSTVGLTAVGMKCPTKAVGEAVWDIPGLTYQGALDRFWTEADSAVPDNRLYMKFRDELITTTQINGSFYRKLAPETSATGLIWTAEATSLPSVAANRRQRIAVATSATDEATPRPPIGEDAKTKMPALAVH